MITDKSRYGHDAVLDVNCGDSVQVLRTEPMTLTEQEQKIVQKYLGIALLEKSYIDANGHLMVVLSDGRTLDVGSARGLSGATPYLGENGNWFVEGVDTLQSARGLPGFTPYIGENEHWWIDETDTGIPARGIPLTEKADNTRFLRNDGTWQKVTPENIGAAKQSVVADHESRIEALEQRTVTAPYYTDDSVAYIKEVPENALSFASVDKVGGITRKSSNLIALPDKTTATASFVYESFKIDSLPVGTYTFSCDHNIPSNVGWWVGLYDESKTAVGTTGTLNSSSNKATITTTGRAEYVNIYVDSAVTLSKIMLNVGDTALPYEPYYDGLRSVPVTEAESVGLNLLADGKVINPETTGRFMYSQLILKPNTTYIASNDIPTSLKSTVGIFFFNSEDLASGAVNQVTVDKPVPITTLSDGIIKIQYIVHDAVYDIENYHHMLNEGSTALPYTPYRRNSLPIPAEVQALDGYGWGVNDEVYNYIDFEKKRFVKRIKCLDMGTVEWTKNQEGQFYHTLSEKAKVAYALNHLCSKYTSSPRGAYDVDTQDKVISVTLSGVWVRDRDYTDAATFKAALSGVMLYYEPAEPVITDISDLLPDDNLIRVEGGGTVTMINEHGYDVPSEITYARLTWQ